MSTYTQYVYKFAIQYKNSERFSMALCKFNYLCKELGCELKHCSHKIPGGWDLEVLADREEDRDALCAKAREVFSHESVKICVWLPNLGL